MAMTFKPSKARTSGRRKKAGNPLFVRLGNWHPQRLLRLCWVLARGQDLSGAGFRLDADKVLEVQRRWPVSVFVETLRIIAVRSHQPDTWFTPFAQKFLPAFREHLQKSVDEDARVQLLWLNKLAKDGAENLIQKLFSIFLKILEPPEKRRPQFRAGLSPFAREKFLAHHQEARDLARGRRLVITCFIDAFLKEIASSGPKEAFAGGLSDDPDFPLRTHQNHPPPTGPDPPV